MQDSKAYSFGVVIVIVAISATMLTVASQKLKPLQEENARLDKYKSIFLATGDFPKQTISGWNAKELQAKFKENFNHIFVDYRGKVAEGVAPRQYDFENHLKKFQHATGKLSAKAPKDGIESVPNVDKLLLEVFVYREAPGSEKAKGYVVPMVGKGLWGTIFGYMCLNKDANTVRGIYFVATPETPGLGKEIEKPKFSNQFKGKKIFNDSGELVSIKTIKPKAPAGDLHGVDAVSSATLTSNGVTAMLKKDLGLFEPYFRSIRAAQQ